MWIGVFVGGEKGDVRWWLHRRIYWMWGCEVLLLENRSLFFPKKRKIFSPLLERCHLRWPLCAEPFVLWWDLWQCILSPHHVWLLCPHPIFIHLIKIVSSNIHLGGGNIIHPDHPKSLRNKNPQIFCTIQDSGFICLIRGLIYCSHEPRWVFYIPEIYS